LPFPSSIAQAIVAVLYRDLNDIIGPITGALNNLLPQLPQVPLCPGFVVEASGDIRLDITNPNSSPCRPFGCPAGQRCCVATATGECLSIFCRPTAQACPCPSNRPTCCNGEPGGGCTKCYPRNFSCP
jgi:hypothetical protein